MKHWLVKSEPESYAWSRFVADGKTAWTGVRSYAARNFLRAMAPGDLVLYYHSVSEKAVVGAAEVTRAAYPDPTAEGEEKAGDWSAVDLRPILALPIPVTLAAIKGDPALQKMELLRQSRLSVTPLTARQFERILALGENSKTHAGLSATARPCLG